MYSLDMYYLLLIFKLNFYVQIVSTDMKEDYPPDRSKFLFTILYFKDITNYIKFVKNILFFKWMYCEIFKNIFLSKCIAFVFSI